MFEDLDFDDPSNYYYCRNCKKDHLIFIKKCDICGETHNTEGPYLRCHRKQLDEIKNEINELKRTFRP